MSTEGKVPRATAEILLSVWSVLMLIVGVYFDIFRVGGMKNYSERSRYFWSREAMCVSDYCHFVLLSEKSLGTFLFVCFSEEFYNIPTDLMFD